MTSCSQVFCNIYTLGGSAKDKQVSFAAASVFHLCQYVKAQTPEGTVFYCYA